MKWTYNADTVRGILAQLGVVLFAAGMLEQLLGGGNTGIATFLMISGATMMVGSVAEKKSCS